MRCHSHRCCSYRGSTVLIESHEFHDELETQHSPQYSDEDHHPPLESEQPAPVEFQMIDDVEILHEDNIIKINEEIPKSNDIVILERCRDSKICQANVQDYDQRGEKSQPHFHKVYVNRMRGSLKKFSIFRRLKNNNLTISEQISKGIDDALRLKRLKEKFNAADDEVGSNGSAKIVHQEARILLDETMPHLSSKSIEPYPTNVTKTAAVKNETTRWAMKSINQEQNQNTNAEIQICKKLHDNNENLRSDNTDLLKMKIPGYIRKKHPSPRELIDEYYRMKDERALDRCAYVNCNNSRFTTGTHLFRFPKNTDSRLSIWIKNAGNARMLHWSLSTIRRAGLCGDHFERKSFFNENRQRLLRSAVPIPFHSGINKLLEKHPNESRTQENLKNISVVFA